MAAKAAQKVARQYTMRLPCINEEEFLRVQHGFPQLLIDYMMGVGFTERISFENKSPWELLYECVSPTSKMHEHILSAIKETKRQKNHTERKKFAETIRVRTKTQRKDDILKCMPVPQSAPSPPPASPPVSDETIIPRGKTAGQGKRVKPTEQLLAEIRGALEEIETNEQKYSNFLQFFKGKQLLEQKKAE